MSDHFDTLETRDPEQRERALFAALPVQIAHAKSRAPAFARLLADVDPREITTRAALAKLPVTRKTELVELPESGAALRRFRGVRLGRARARVRVTGPHLRA